jgi:hypothetical protein
MWQKKWCVSINRVASVSWNSKLLDKYSSL